MNKLFDGVSDTSPERMLARIVRVGLVSDVNGTQCRVIFPDNNQTSGWLHVLQHSGAALHIPEAGAHTHTATVRDTYSGGGTATISEDGAHTHASAVTQQWIPKINSKVLILYIPVDNGDGFVLGEIG